MCPYAYPHNHKLSGVFAGCHLLCILLGVLDALLWGPGSFSVDEQGDFFTSSSFSVILSQFYFVFFPLVYLFFVLSSPPPPNFSLLLLSLCCLYMFLTFPPTLFAAFL
ncbi:hypothetical protein BDE02_06G212200 [Populus trichocarpa]|nr:hypothetical protein BDE02_06G212200 [Populus trichocarpa]